VKPFRAVPIGAALAVLAAGSVVLAQLSRVPADLGWVGLYNNQLIEWLENENRLDELCAQFAGRTDQRDRCRLEKLEPRPYVVPLRAAPSASSRWVGSLLLLATPGKGLHFFYAGQGGGLPREFTPDLHLQDWGYGPYFHQTYLERRGDWFLLPEDPFPMNTWTSAKRRTSLVRTASSTARAEAS
jgi:hypothetical protein